MGSLKLAPALNDMVATGIKAKLGWVLRFAGDTENKKAEFPQVEIRILTTKQWKRLEKSREHPRNPWAAQCLDDGMMIAARLFVDYHDAEVSGIHEPDPDRAAAIRQVRGRLIDFLDSEELLTNVQVDLDGCCGATFLCHTTDSHDENGRQLDNHSMVITLGDDPDQ